MKRGMLRSWARMLLVQASWSYDRMVGIGVAFASEPLLRDLPGGTQGDRYRAALGRAGQYFNAHPYLSALAVGALARVEHEDIPEEQVRRLRTALIGPLGSVGDKLVWAGALPLASGLGIVLAALVSPLAAVIGFLVLYNAVHLTLRGWALAAGWRGGIRVAQELGVPAVMHGLRIAGPLAGLALGLALPPAVEWLVRDFDGNALVGVGVVAVVGVIVARSMWMELGTIRFGLAVVLLALVAGRL